jgi:5-methylcytosine-specific restriction protein A
MSARPCLTCGEPSAASYCDDHQPATWQHRKGTAHQRGYDAAWNRLSRRARRLQPFCSDCGTTEDLTTDHLPSAWQRKAEGKPLRLRDVDVVCAPCNLARGTSRPGSQRAREDQGTGAVEQAARPRAKAQSPLHSGDDSNAAENNAEPAEPQSPFLKASEPEAGRSFAVVNAEHDGNNKGGSCDGEFHQARLS